MPDWLFEVTREPPPPLSKVRPPGVSIEQYDVLLPPALRKEAPAMIPLKEQRARSKAEGKCVRCFTNVATYTMPCCQCRKCPKLLCQIDHEVSAKMGHKAQEHLARLCDAMCPHALTGGDTIHPGAPTDGDTIRPRAPAPDGTIAPHAPAGDTN